MAKSIWVIAESERGSGIRQIYGYVKVKYSREDKVLDVLRDLADRLYKIKDPRIYCEYNDEGPCGYQVIAIPDPVDFNNVELIATKLGPAKDACRIF